MQKTTSETFKLGDFKQADGSIDFNALRVEINHYDGKFGSLIIATGTEGNSVVLISEANVGKLLDYIEEARQAGLIGGTHG